MVPALLRSPLLSVLFSRWMHRTHLSEWYQFFEPVFFEFYAAFQQTTQSIINCTSHGGWPSFISVHWANVLHRTFGVMCQCGDESLFSPFAVRGDPATAAFPGVVLPTAPVSHDPTTHEACEVLCGTVWRSLRCLALRDQTEPAPPCVFALPHTHGVEYIHHRLASESGLPVQRLPHITQLSSPLALSALVSRHAGCDPSVRLWLLSTRTCTPSLSLPTAIRFRNVFAPALRRYKAFPTHSRPVLHGDVGAEGKILCDQEFHRIWDQETSARRDVLAPCWDPRRRVITNKRRKWEHVEKSWDRINSVLDFSSASHICKIADLRLTHVSVTQLGSFVYVAWIKGDGRVYIGQTGGRARRRSVGQRGREHVRNGMDVVRLRTGHKLHVPSDLYQLLRKVGVENLIVTPLESVPPHKLDDREMWWIRKWGLGQVLNRQLPSLKSEKWSFLFRRKVWEREL